MKRICIAIVLIGQIARGQVVPPIVYDIESDWQQTQELPDQAFVQGAGVSLRYRIKTSGRYLALAGLGARWDGRLSATSTQAVQAVAVVVTNVTPNYFQVTLSSDQTGSAVSDWLYSFIVTAGGVDYPLGVGALDIAASGWTGASAVLLTETAAAYADAAVSAHAATIASAGTLGHIRIGAGLTIDGAGIVTADGAAPDWGSIIGTQSDVAVSGFTNDAGYLTTYLRDIPAAGDRVTITPSTNGTVITHTITAQTPDLSGYVPTNDAAYLAALTNATGGAGISITGSGRTREIASTITQYTDALAVAAINADATYTQTVALAAGAVQTEADPVAMAALAGYVETNHSGNVTIDGATVLTNSAVLQVTGDGGPVSPNGNYVAFSDYYVLQGGDEQYDVLFFSDPVWNLQTGGVDGPIWQNPIENTLEGTYSPAFQGATGTPTVSSYTAPPLSVQGAVFVSGDVEAGSVTLSDVTRTTWPTSGVADHTNLTSLAWVESGHTGTAARVAIFSEGGIAGLGTLGTGLSWDGDTINASGGGGGTVTNLNDLADVDTTGVTLNDVLGYNGTNWTPRAQSGGSVDLDDLFAVEAISTAAYTATVSRVAHESEYRMTMTSSNYLTISAATFPTNKAHTIGLSIWTGGNVLTADTNIIDATMWEAVDISTNAWDRLIFDRGYGQIKWGVLKGGAL